jgi:ABC-type transporter Mla subunit MlaD
MINKIEEIKRQKAQLVAANQQLKANLKQTAYSIGQLQKHQHSLSQLLKDLKQVFNLTRSMRFFTNHYD